VGVGVSGWVWVWVGVGGCGWVWVGGCGYKDTGYTHTHPQAFWRIQTVCCFVTKPLTAKASIDSSKRLVSDGGISYAVDINVRTLENLLNIIIGSEINANSVDWLSFTKDSCHVNSRQISLGDQRS
jgi:hypothetical protein